MKKLLLLLFIMFHYNYTGYAQNNGFTGGFQFKAMLGNSVFNNEPVEGDIDSISISVTQNFGYVFGMTIRKQFTKVLAIESGLRFAQRNYTTNIDSTFGNYNGEIDYRLIAYEIPIKAMVRLRASDRSYFSVSLGVQIDLYPSNVQATDFIWQVQVIRRSWIQGSMLANLGWEFTPPDLGTFYAGLSFNQPFVDPYAQKSAPDHYTFAVSNIRLNGAYFALDLRYYFQVKKDKPMR
jgi:hypothetical protein